MDSIDPMGSMKGRILKALVALEVEGTLEATVDQVYQKLIQMGLHIQSEEGWFIRAWIKLNAEDLITVKTPGTKPTFILTDKARGEIQQ